MGTAVKKGDKVTVTITGTVGDYQSAHNACHKITTDTGNTCYVYFGGSGGVRTLLGDGETKYGVTLKIHEPEPIAGELYKDADGEILLRVANGQWQTMTGSIKMDSYASRPLRRLVPEKEAA